MTASERDRWGHVLGYGYGRSVGAPLGFESRELAVVAGALGAEVHLRGGVASSGKCGPHAPNSTNAGARFGLGLRVADGRARPGPPLLLGGGVTWATRHGEVRGT